MVKYILNYFPLGGRAEPIRLMFHAAGVQYEDNVVHFKDWAQLKTDNKRFPLGQGPTLQVDDEVICQSRAINRYVANQLSMNGSTNEEKMVIDQITESMDELFDAWVKIIFNKSTDKPAKEAEFKTWFASESMTRLCRFIEGLLAKTSGPFVLGDKVSLADCVCYHMYDILAQFHTGFVAEYPGLTALHKAVEEVESIKKYLDARREKIAKGEFKICPTL